MNEIWTLTAFTVGVSVAGTIIALPVALLLAWTLARRRFFGKSFVETFVALPLVVPPVATGLILLRVFGRDGPLGAWFDRAFGLQIVFTWRAVVLAAAVMSLPLLVRTTRAAFETVNPRFEQVACTLGAGRMRTFLTVTLPLARSGVIAGTILAFARALGEFGATIMVAGFIPGETATLSLAIYHHIQLGNDTTATVLVLISCVLAFGAVWMSEWLLRVGKPWN